MSELHNPLFDEEKEFLERKKLEYERALRGDVDHIKDQSVMVGKVALVGAGLAGGVWLITKVFGGKKRKKRRTKAENKEYESADYYDHDSADAFEDTYGPGYSTSGNGKRYKSTEPYKSAAASAQVFEEHHEQTHEADDLGFGSTAAKPFAEPAAKPFASDDDFEEDPFQDLPYDDSRRLSASHTFEDGPAAPAASPGNSRSRLIGSLLQAFLRSDTGKVLVAQVAAVGLAMVTKKVGEFFPTTKNSDLAASPGVAPAAFGDYPAASSVSSAPSDASNPPQSL
jgi:hypothetical protein